MGIQAMITTPLAPELQATADLLAGYSPEWADEYRAMIEVLADKCDPLDELRAKLDEKHHDT